MLRLLTRISDGMEDRLIETRRDLHRFPELGWTEFRTASLVARRLADLDWEVQLGREVHREESRMGVPAPDVLATAWERARDQGGDPQMLARLKGGGTGVVGTLRAGEGPTVALRFDMDALPIRESQSPEHRPYREGFASQNPGVMHACGHDGHTAVGLGIAEVLARVKEHLHGTVRLIFQPAEEGVRGAKSMVGAGLADDVDYLMGSHLFPGWALGETICGLGGYAATEKFDAVLKGAPAHAGANPQDGKNALLAAATAVLNLFAIPRHEDGATRINVGRLEAGGGRNVVPADARLMIETRGANSDLSQYMYAHALRILETSAAMYGCKLEILPMGAAPSADSDPALSKRAQEVARRVGLYRYRPPAPNGGSEDLTYFMRRVQEHGGQAVSIGFGAGLLQAGESESVLRAHTDDFDFDERVLRLMVRLLAALTLDLMNRG